VPTRSSGYCTALEIGEVSAARHRLVGHGAHETKVPRPMLQFATVLSQLNLTSS